MPITKAQATKLLNAIELKLYEESRLPQLRKLAASQLDRRVTRMRELRDKSRDLLQRQRLQTRERTGNKRGRTGIANERTKQKSLIMADILRRFEGQLGVARQQESQGKLPKKTTSTKKARPASAVRSAQASSERMRSRKSLEEKAAATLSRRRTNDSGEQTAARKRIGEDVSAPIAKRVKKRTTEQMAKPHAAAIATKRASKKSTIQKTHASQNTADQTPASRELKNAQTQSGGKKVPSEEFQSHAAMRKAKQRKFQESRLQPIQAHISSHDRRMQAKRDQR